MKHPMLAKVSAGRLVTGLSLTLSTARRRTPP